MQLAMQTWPTSEEDPENRPQGLSPRPSDGEQWGVPLLAERGQGKSRSLLDIFICPSSQPQVMRHKHKHLYLMVVEMSINWKPVSFYFCPCYHGELGPLAHSSIADGAGQGSWIMFLLALGIQSTAFVTWVTWKKWNHISILYSCSLTSLPAAPQGEGSWWRDGFCIIFLGGWGDGSRRVHGCTTKSNRLFAKATL